MKICIVTLHRIVNYGSVLQAYATQKTFLKLGCSVEFIDYYDGRMTLLGMALRLRNKKPILENSFFLRSLAQIVILPSYLKRFYIFKSFIKKQLFLSAQTYKSFDDLESHYPHADIYCTGSDQVWNSTYNEKIDKVFFLDFVQNGKKCISYSSSFGKSSLLPEEKKETSNLLQKYDFISVREKTGIEILQDLNIGNAEHVLDPTLVLDKKDWAPLISKKFTGKNYILIYNLNRSHFIEQCARKLSKKYSLNIYSVSYNFHEFYRAGKVITCPPVQDFLSLVSNAKYILTDSFHATAFSANFGKNVFVFYPSKFSTRLKSLVDMLGIPERVVHNFDDLLRVTNHEIDAPSIQNRLSDHRKRTIGFLKSAMK